MNRLVILAPNWLGDAVMALPAMADLGRALPGVSMSVAARPAVAPLFEMVPGIDDVVVLDRPIASRAWSALSAVQSVRAEEALLRDRRFDAALVFPNAFRAALVAYRAGIPERWGYRADGRTPLLTRAVARPPAGTHQAERYQHLVHALGFPNGPIEPRLAVSDRLRASGVEALAGLGWDRVTPLVAIAPGAAYGGAKRWPPKYFAELVGAFAADGVCTLMIGSQADRPDGGEIEAALGGRAPLLNAMGMPLPTVVGMLTHARSLVCNDSGAMHVGAAIGVPVTAVFGPTKERETAPRGETVNVVSSPVWCRPCMLRECPLDHRCMHEIGVRAVVDASRRSL